MDKNVHQSPAVEVDSQTSSPLLRRAAISLLLGVKTQAVGRFTSESASCWSADDPSTDDSSRSSPRDTRQLSPEPYHTGGLSPEPLTVTGNKRCDTRQYKNELWAAIRSDYAYLMDEEIIDACKSTESEFSSDDMSTESKVSYNEFIQQYNELNDWLGNLRKTVCRQTASHSEGYLNQIYYEEMLNQSPRQCLLNDYAKALLQRYPQLKQEIVTRLTRVNDQWVDVLGKLAVPPGNRSIDLTTILSDVERDITCLRQWVKIAEEKIESLCLSLEWSFSDIQTQLVDHQVMQKDIESKSRIASAILKLCEWLSKLNDVDDDMEMERSRLDRDAVRLEQRCHCVWIKSIEWQVRLEEALKGQQSCNRPRLPMSVGIPAQRSEKSSCSSRRSCSDSSAEMEGANSDIIPFRDSEYEELSDGCDQQLLHGGGTEDELSDIESARFESRPDEDLSLASEWLEPKDEISSRRFRQQLGKLDVDGLSGTKSSSGLKLRVTRCDVLDVGYSSEGHSYDDRAASSGKLIETTEEHTENTDDILGVEPNTGLMYVGPHSATSAYNSLSDLSESHRDMRVGLTENISSGRLVKAKERNAASGLGTATKKKNWSPVTTSSADHHCLPPLHIGSVVDGFATDDDFSKLKELSYDDIPMKVTKSTLSPLQPEYAAAHVPRRQGRSLDSVLPMDSEKMFHFEKRVSSVEIIMDSLNSSKDFSESTGCHQQQLNSSVNVHGDMVLSSCDASSEGESECSESTTSEEEIGTPTKRKSSRRQRHSRNRNRAGVLSSSGLVRSPMKRRVDSLTDVSEVGAITGGLFLRSSSDGALNDLSMGHSSIKRSKVSRAKSEIMSPKSSGSCSSRTCKKGKAFGELPSRKSHHSHVLCLKAREDNETDVRTSFSDDAICSDVVSCDQSISSCQDISVIMDSDSHCINEHAVMDECRVQDDLMTDDQSQDSCGLTDEIHGSKSMESMRGLQTWQDSDSDMEDFINIVRESHKAYKFTESTVSKFVKEHTGGVVRDPVEYSGPLATCQTNISCLSELVDALQSANRFADADSKIDQIQNIVSRWQKLEAETVSQQQQCRLLYILYAERIRVEKQLTVISQEVNAEQFDDLNSLELAFRTVQASQNDLEMKIGKQIQLLQHKVNQFQRSNPNIDMSRFVASCKLLKETAYLLINKCSHQQTALKKSLMSWYQFNELERHLDYVVCHEQHQIECLTVAADVVSMSNDDSCDTIGDLKMMRNSWSTYTDKLALMECLRNELIAVCTPNAMLSLQSTVDDLTHKIQSVKDKCDDLIESLLSTNNDDDGMETDGVLFDNVESSDDTTVLLVKHSVSDDAVMNTSEAMSDEVKILGEHKEKDGRENLECHVLRNETAECQEISSTDDITGALMADNSVLDSICAVSNQKTFKSHLELVDVRRSTGHNQPGVATVPSRLLHRMLKYALPLPILVMLLFGGLYLLYGDWSDWLDQFGLVLSPQLHHVHGAPPT